MADAFAKTNELRHTINDPDRIPAVIHQCSRCGHTWIPRGWVTTYCPSCNSTGVKVWLENEDERNRMTETDVSRHSTKGKPRFITIGGRVIQFSSEPNAPIIDVKCLPKIDVVCKQLASINRFNGATIRPYSVAQHSCLVGSLVASRRPELELPALLHDLPEIVYGDIVTGVKNSIGMVMTRFFEQIDMIVMNYYIGRFGFKYPLPQKDHDLIKQADNFALLCEAQSLLQEGSRPSDNPELWPLETEWAAEDFNELITPLNCQDCDTASAKLLERIKSAASSLAKKSK